MELGSSGRQTRAAAAPRERDIDLALLGPFYDLVQKPPRNTDFPVTRDTGPALRRRAALGALIPKAKAEPGKDINTLFFGLLCKNAVAG